MAERTQQPHVTSTGGFAAGARLDPVQIRAEGADKVKNEPHISRTLALSARLPVFLGTICALMVGILIWASPASSLDMTAAIESHCPTEMTCHAPDRDTCCQGHLCSAEVSVAPVGAASAETSWAKGLPTLFHALADGIRPDFDPPPPRL